MTPPKAKRLAVIQKQDAECWRHCNYVPSECTGDGEASIVIAYRGHWRAFCRSCWAVLTSEERKTRAARTRAFKKAQIPIPFTHGIECSCTHGTPCPVAQGAA